MALRKAGLPISFAGGLNTKPDHKTVPTTQLLDLQNAVFTRETTLSKRFGYEARSRTIDGAGAMYENARGLASRDDELLLFSDDHCYSYRPSSDTWSDAGEISSTVVRDVPIARTGTAQTCGDCATVSGVSVVAWEDSRGGVRMSVVEDGTGRILLPDVELSSTGSQPRCIVLDTVLAVLYTIESTGLLMIALVNPALPTATPVPTILTNDLLTTNARYDAEPIPVTFIDGVNLTGGGGAIAWVVPGGYRVGYIHPSGVLGSPVTGLPSVATWADVVTGPIAIATDKNGAATDSIAVLWESTPSSRVIAGRFHNHETLTVAWRSAAQLGAVLSQACQHLTCEFGAVNESVSDEAPLFWAAEMAGSTTHQHLVYVGKSYQDDAVSDLDASIIRGHVLISRAFHDGTRLAPVGGSIDTQADGHVYVAMAHAVRFFPYVAIVRISADDIGTTETITAARCLPGTSTGAIWRGTALTNHLPSVEAIGLSGSNVYSRQHRIPMGIRIQLDSEDGDQFAEAGIRLTTVDFDHASSHQSAQLGRGLYLAGGLPHQYDGNRWVEAGYHTAPDWGFEPDGDPVDAADAFTPQNAGGGMAAGTYLYKLWYEDVDGQGELHPGPTSIGVLVTVPADGSDQVSIEVPTYRLTRKTGVRVCVARSVAGQTGTDTSIPLYRVTGIDPVDNTGNNRFALNDTTVDAITIVDALSDADLLKREPLYTNGGILSNAPSPWAGDVIVGAKSRLFWTDPSDPNLVRFSQQLRDETGLEAPVDLSIRVDPYGGAIAGIAEMDGAIYPLKETAIFVFGGPGPQANPSVAPESFSFTPPELVTADAGCASPTTIVQTPPGIMFDTEKGIRMLSRQRQLIPIGDPVEAYNGQTYKRATLIPDRPHVLFLTDSGSTLLFDYERGQWSRFTNHEGLDATLIDGVYHYLRTDGRVFAETDGLYRDDNSQIVMKIETAWIKMIQYLQGWQKVLYANFLGEYKSAHTLRVRYRIDYQAGYSAPFDLDVNVNFDPALYGEGLYGAGLYGGAEAASTVYQRRIHLNRRCQSISFLIEDVEATDDFGASFELSELLLSGGVLGPEFKMGAARSS